MESLKKKWNNLPLRRFLALMVLLALGIVVLLSALIIGGCVSFRHWLLPNADAAYLTIEKTLSDGSVCEEVCLLGFGEDLSSLPLISVEYDDVLVQESAVQTRYSIQKIETGVSTLTPKRKLAYRICGVTMFIAPTILAFTAIFLCSMAFYRYKLKVPLKLMADATKKIAEQSLDFKLDYPYSDEMGDLCRSFESMRAALYESNKAMWNMLEERRLIQASVAHDLRNPIAIIEGYTEYLESGLKDGEMHRDKLLRIAQNLNIAAGRLAQYTESVRLINQSQEASLNREPVSAGKLAERMTEDLMLLAEQGEIELQVANSLPDEEIQVDTVLLSRILENIVSNALRYAKREVRLDFALTGRLLTVTVADDGDGFTSEIVNQRRKILPAVGKDGHMGIGLSISRLLCQKHGGNLELYNTSCGACVKISLSV